MGPVTLDLSYKKIFGPKREEVAGGWRRLHNEELHNLYASQNIIRVIKSKRMIWVGHVACRGRSRNAHNVMVEKLEAKRPRHRCKTILELILGW
jgi:hypothetical protein